jgi:hypothetical protein
MGRRLFEAGQTILVQDAPGDRYFIIADVS